MKRKIPLMILTILMLQVVLPVLTIIFESGFTIESIAASEITSGDWSYTINEDETTITITEYRGTEKNLVIPSEIDGYIVTVLGGNIIHEDFYGGEYNSYSVFRYGNCINTIKLPNTLVTIGNSAFDRCNNMISVNLNEGLVTIGNNAFSKCKKLECINIPSTVSLIVNYNDLNSFYGCEGLESITVHSDNQYYSSIDGVLYNKDGSILIAYPSSKQDKNFSIPATVEHVYGHAFDNQYIETLSISKYTNKMEGDDYWKSHFNTFSILQCDNLQNIIVDSSNENFSSEDGILYSKDKSKLLLYPSGKTNTTYNIPSTVSGCGFTGYTIINPYLETIKVNSLISDLEILTSITNLKNIEIDTENVNYTQKDGVAFSKNGDKLLYYPMGRTQDTYVIDSNVIEIGEGAFENSKIKEITLPSNLTTIGNYAFYNCQNLNDVTLPSTVTTIGNYAFYECKGFENIIFPSNLTKIGTKAFYKCSNMKEVIFDEDSKLEQIGDDAFSYCTLIEKISIPEGVTDIDGCFDCCDNLRIIDIPSTVSDIPSYSFNNKYTRSQIVTTYNENPTIKGWAFTNPDFGKTIIRCYSSATELINWANSHGDFHYNLMDLDEDDIKFLYVINEDNEVIIENYIGDEETVEIPTQIEGYPVTGIARCDGTYKSLSIPSTVEAIGGIFSSNLENIYVDIDNQNFTSKDGILFSKNEKELICYPMGKKEVSYSIPEGTTLIGGNTSVVVGSAFYTPKSFNGNMYLQSLYIPSSVTRINSYSVSGMENLSEIIVDDENQNYVVKDNILYEINSNETKIVAVPKKLEGNIELLYGLTRINTYTFENIRNLETVVVPTTVEVISHNAFSFCDSLKKLVITPTTELTEINAGNLSFGRASNILKVYCEEGSIAQEHSRKWGIDYEIIEPTKIEVKQNPDKLSYIKNQETLNLEGGLITITYDDGTALDLAMTSDLLSITGFDNSSIGNKQVEVDYKGNKTNFTVSVTAGEGTLLKGDVNGDNQVNFRDILVINNHRLGKTELTGIYLELADVTGDGNIDFRDILQVNRYRLGKIDSL